jgi:preprotein translocase subunit SecD
LTSKNQPFAEGTPRARQLAIVVHGEVMATPSIRSLIAGPECMISGHFSKQAADTVVTLLRSAK